jgi:hypothetical protein
MRLVHIVQQLAPLPKRTQWQQYSAAAGVAMLQEVAARVSTAVTYSFEIDAGKYGQAAAPVMCMALSAWAGACHRLLMAFIWGF